MTVLRGQIVFRDGEPVGTPRGKPATCGAPVDNVGRHAR